MGQTISDYAKIKTLESILMSDLVDKMTYLLSIRDAIANNLKEVDDMIEEMNDEISKIIKENN
jgi:hypothetical protein